MRKLEQICDETGLEARYGGGDYIVRVFDDMQGDYDLFLYRTSDAEPFKREVVLKHDLEACMRDRQPDLRRWRKVKVEQS